MIEDSGSGEAELEETVQARKQSASEVLCKEVGFSTSYAC
jgi:hypothetical protein